MASFRKIKLEISKTNGYYQYVISAKYRGKYISTHSSNSQAFDWLNDDSNKEKHLEAKRACYYAIVTKYSHLFK